MYFFQRNNVINFNRLIAISTFFISGSVFALQVPPSFENKSIDIGSCTGSAIHYENSSGSGIGNAFALFSTSSGSYNVNPHYDGTTPGVPYSSPPNITGLTSANILTTCGVADAVLTVTGVASGPYATTALIGYKLEGKDPNNGNASTLWEVAVSGVTNTQTIAKKNSVLAQPDSGSGVAGTPISPVNVLANDNTDGVSSTLSNSVLTVVSPASNSGVALDVDTGYVTTNATVPAGTYTLTYQLCNSAASTLCTQATVTITLSDPPIVPPVINDSSYTTQMNVALNANVGTGGQVPVGSTYQIAIASTSGQLAIDAATGDFTYTPNTGFTGVDSAMVRVCLPAPNNTVCDDATLTFTVQGGAVGTATSVPTLGEWSLIGLTSLVALFGASRMRKRQI